MNGFKYTNKLVDEASPYLLQHAHNPVNWYPWGEEALAYARKENLPIFLSIGYAACHWCHVMEKESFENVEIAEILNRNFVPIKVDREERPDLDEIYMNAVTLLSGSGGWPLSVWLTPDLKPFFGGTYFPPEDQWGRIGFRNILLRISDLWRDQQKEVISGAESLTQSINQLNSNEPAQFEPGLELWQKAVLLLSNMYDEKNGGFGRAPKFPRPMDLSFLLRYYFYTNDRKILGMVEKTLRSLANGGIFDQLGGGFHRYATDEKWLVPHFEKMLYDNALLPIVYLETSQITGETFYKEIAEGTLDFVLDEMADADGGFYSSLDADSEGVEGKYYVWSKEEIDFLLDKKSAEVFCAVFGVREKGNWNGKTILRRKMSNEEAAERAGISGNGVEKILKQAKKKLLQNREKRIKPFIDDKIITAWNGLMIIALCKGNQILGKKSYAEAARKAADFLLEKMFVDGELFRIFSRGKVQQHGYLTDYALLSSALIELYATTFEIRYLLSAIEINDLCIEKFWDQKSQSFYFTPHDQKNLLFRTRNEFDNVIPAGNSVAVHNLFRLYQFTGKKEYQDIAYKAILAVGDQVNRSPAGFPFLLSVSDAVWANPKEIIISGDRKNSLFGEFVSSINKHYFPNKIVGWADNELKKTAPEAARWLIFQGKFQDTVEVYICENYSCHSPVKSVEELGEFFNSHRVSA